MCEAFHAEANALYSMQKRGISTEGCVLFTTASPCRACAEKILGAGISKVYYYLGYPDDYTFDYLHRYGVEVVKVKQEKSLLYKAKASDTPYNDKPST